MNVPTSHTLHSRLPPLFLGFLIPISSVSTSTAKYSVSIRYLKCHFRKGANLGNQTLTGKSKVNFLIKENKTRIKINTKC